MKTLVCYKRILRSRPLLGIFCSPFMLFSQYKWFKSSVLVTGRCTYIVRIYRSEMNRKI